MISTGILRGVADFVKDIFEKQMQENLSFHNYQHTQNVVSAVDRICSASKIEPYDHQLVLIAAWFHNIGFSEHYEMSEYFSQQIAGAYMRNNGFYKEDIDKVVGCIEATKLPQNPQNKLEEILCDADLSHLASNCYLMYLSDLRNEWRHFLGQTYSEDEWWDLNLDFFRTHHYFTKYGIEHLTKRKFYNFLQLKNKQFLTACRPGDWVTDTIQQ